MIDKARQLFCVSFQSALNAITNSGITMNFYPLHSHFEECTKRHREILQEIYGKIIEMLQSQLFYFRIKSVRKLTQLLQASSKRWYIVRAP